MSFRPEIVQLAGQGRRPGFTLVEMVAVMFGLSLIMLVGVSMLVGAFKIRQASSSAQDLAIHRQVLAEQFREDVAQAAALPEKLDKWTAGPTCLILKGQSQSSIVYEWKSDILERTDLPRNGTQKLAVGPKGSKIEFVHSGKLVTLKISPPPPGPGKSGFPLDISAALGGNLR